MFKIQFDIYFYFNIAINCDELFDKISAYDILVNILSHKICEESTVNGVFNVDKHLLTKINECERIEYFKVYALFSYSIMR